MRFSIVFAVVVVMFSLQPQRPITAQTPTAQEILFDKGGQITLIKSDGTGEQNLSKKDDATDSQPVWSPDGTKIVFVSDRLAESFEKTLGSRNNLFVMNANGSDLKNLTKGKEKDTSPAFSPDGTQIAFIRKSPTANAQIMLMQADGSNPQMLIASPDANPVGALAWFPDGKMLTFKVLSLTAGKVVDAYIFEIASKKLTKVAKQPDGSTPAIVAAGREWSPALKKSVFIRRDTSRDTNDEAGFTVFTASADGKDEAPLLKLPLSITTGQTLRDGGNFAWSSDSKMLAFDAFDPRYRRTQLRQLVVMNADGTGVKVLTSDTQRSAAFPAWRPIKP